MDDAGNTQPWPPPHPQLGTPMGKQDIARELGITVAGVELAIWRTRNGTAAVPFPAPAGHGRRPGGRDQATPYWWSTDVGRYAAATRRRP